MKKKMSKKNTVKAGIKTRAMIVLAMVAIMIASLLDAVVPMGSASTGHTNEITPGVSNRVIIGQVLEFRGVDLGHSIVGHTPGAVEGVTVGTATEDFDSTLFLRAGTYFVDNVVVDGELTTNETVLSVATLTFALRLVEPGTKDEISVVTEG